MREHAPVALMNQSSNVSAYMSIYVHAQASAASLQRTLNLSANKYYYYYVVRNDPDMKIATNAAEGPVLPTSIQLQPVGSFLGLTKLSFGRVCARACDSVFLGGDGRVRVHK